MAKAIKRNYKGGSGDASAIEYTKEDGTKSTVQDELTVVNDSLNELNNKIGGDEMIDLFYGSLEERNALATAITNKGVATNVTDTLLSMANNVSNINSPNIHGTPSISAPESASPTISVEKDKLYVFTLAVQGVTNSCSLVSGATQIHKLSQYRSCGKGLYMHTFLIRTTSTTVQFSINDNPAVAWFKVEE